MWKKLQSVPTVFLLASLFPALLLYPTGAEAFKGKLISWKTLTNEADVIVIAKVTEAKLRQGNSGHPILLSLRAEEYLKGNGAIEFQVNVRTGVSPVRTGATGLFFGKKRHGKEEYELVDRIVGAQELVSLFCFASVPGSNRTPGFGVKRHGEILVEIPEDIVIRPSECPPPEYYSSNFLSLQKLKEHRFRDASDPPNE